MEKDIEEFCCALAERHGWAQWKWVSPGQKGVNDRLFLKDGRWVPIEFKQYSGRRGSLQRVQHEKIRSHGGEVHLCDNVRDFCRILGIPFDVPGPGAVPAARCAVDPQAPRLRPLGRHGTG